MSLRNIRLGDVITLKRGHDLPDTKRQEGDVPVVSSSGITGYHNEPKAMAPGVSVANDLSGLLRLPLEVTNARDRDATGDPEDAI